MRKRSCVKKRGDDGRTFTSTVSSQQYQIIPVALRSSLADGVGLETRMESVRTTSERICAWDGCIWMAWSRGRDQTKRFVSHCYLVQSPWSHRRIVPSRHVMLPQAPQVGMVQATRYHCHHPSQTNIKLVLHLDQQWLMYTYLYLLFFHLLVLMV